MNIFRKPLFLFGLINTYLYPSFLDGSFNPNYNYVQLPLPQNYFILFRFHLCFPQFPVPTYKLIKLKSEN